MVKTRVMLIDAAVTVRRILAELVSQESDLEVVGTAPNGRLAIAKMGLLKPDVLVCDAEMADMSRAELLVELKKLNIRLPVITLSNKPGRMVASHHYTRGLGSAEEVQKPSSFVAGDEALKVFQEELINKIRLERRKAGIGIVPNKLEVSSASESAVPVSEALAGLSVQRNSRVIPPRPSQLISASAPRPSSRVARIDVIAIGVSTGGPDALTVVIPEIPRALSVPILIVQHMPPVFTRLLAERLASRAQMPVEECVPGTILEPGKVWIAPGNFHMVVEREGVNTILRTHQGPQENSCRPAVDVLFRSVAEHFGANCLGVILTGMGQDGLKGCEALSRVGAQVIVQDEPTSVVWGMPGAVTRAGLANRVLPLKEIASEITRRVSDGRFSDALRSAS